MLPSQWGSPALRAEGPAEPGEPCPAGTRKRPSKRLTAAGGKRLPLPSSCRPGTRGLRGPPCRPRVQAPCSGPHHHLLLLPFVWALNRLVSPGESSTVAVGGFPENRQTGDLALNRAGLHGTQAQRTGGPGRLRSLSAHLPPGSLCLDT